MKGNTGSADGSSTTALSSQASPSMWRWQSLQELQYPVAEYLSGQKNLPVFVGMESVVAGHEHTSMSVVSGQVVGKNGAVGREQLRAGRRCQRARSVVVLLRSR